MFDHTSDAAQRLTASLVGVEVAGGDQRLKDVPLACKKQLPSQRNKGDRTASRPAGEQREKKFIL